jgi:hypothetical protein
MLVGDIPASESVRVLLTAWDDPELARCVTADILHRRVDLDRLVTVGKVQ